MKKPAEVSAPKRQMPTGTPFQKGQSGNPGGQSREKRAFLDRLHGADAEVVYTAFMALVSEGNAPAVIRAVEYLAGRPPAATEDTDALRDGLTIVIQSLAEAKK